MKEQTREVDIYLVTQTMKDYLKLKYKTLFEKIKEQNVYALVTTNKALVAIDRNHNLCFLDCGEKINDCHNFAKELYESKIYEKTRISY